MGLDFTGISDRAGAAIYMIYDGTVSQKRVIEHLAEELTRQNIKQQIVILSARDREAEKVRDFYDLSSMSFPHILVIGDDDRIFQAWSGPHLPLVDHIAHTLRTL